MELLEKVFSILGKFIIFAVSNMEDSMRYKRLRFSVLLFFNPTQQCGIVFLLLQQLCSFFVPRLVPEG